MTYKLIKEFKEFALKGNMIDIAIGVIIGIAFNNVVQILVNTVIMPPLSLLTDGATLENKRIILREAVLQDQTIILEEVAIGYGQLIGALIDFFIIGLTVFFVVKIMNAIQKKAEDPKDNSEATPKDIELLDKISELMEKQVELLENSSANS